MNNFFRARVVCFGALLGLAPLVGAAPVRGQGADVWTVSSRPTLIVGLDVDTPEAALRLVNGAVRLPDGSVLVANGGVSPRLPVFSPTGAYVRSIGRQGDGPGEYRWITSIQSGAGDSIFIFDAGQQRMTVVLPDGSVAGTTESTIDPLTVGAGLQKMSVLADGSYVGRGASRARAGQPYEIIRDTISMGLMDRDLTEFRRIARLPDRMTTTSLVAGRRSFRAPAFSPEVVHGVWGTCAFVSTGETATISVYDREGARVAEFEGPGSLRPVTDGHIELRAEATLLVAPEHEKPLVRRMLREEAKTEHLPFYSAIVLDEWGHLWLQEYSPPWGVGRTWHVVSQHGEHLGDVELPEPLMVFAIDRHGVLGAGRGPFDEETVALFPFDVRPSRTSPPLSQCVN